MTDKSVTAEARPRKRQGPREETARRRRDILVAATQVFAAKGYKGGTLAEIAELAGMTHAGVLHHFGSKHNLLEAVIDFRDQADSSAAHAAYGLDLFRHLVDTAAKNAGRPGIVQTYVVLSAESVTDGNPGKVYFSGRFAVLRDMVKGELAKLNPADDPLTDEELGLAASNTIALMDGLQVQWLLDPGAVDLAAATAFGLEGLLRNVAAGAGRRRPVAPPAQAAAGR
ncbi:MAG: TetR/AcrR family transcriptional regulator [Propionibacteriaceae bacterium]|nr:TetR/AcrR family transcriptional regulator [Propionibacteriaceae bacterium]